MRNFFIYLFCLLTCIISSNAFAVRKTVLPDGTQIEIDVSPMTTNGITDGFSGTVKVDGKTVVIYGFGNQNNGNFDCDNFGIRPPGMGGYNDTSIKNHFGSKMRSIGNEIGIALQEIGVVDPEGTINIAPEQVRVVRPDRPNKVKTKRGFSFPEKCYCKGLKKLPIVGSLFILLGLRQNGFAQTAKDVAWDVASDTFTLGFFDPDSESAMGPGDTFWVHDKPYYPKPEPYGPFNPNPFPNLPEPDYEGIDFFPESPLITGQFPSYW